MAPWGLCRPTVNMRDAWCQSSAECWRKWRASPRSTPLCLSWWDQDEALSKASLHKVTVWTEKSKMPPVTSWFFCFTAHRLSLWCCYSLAQGATVFPKIFLPKAPVNKHKGIFCVSFYRLILSTYLCWRWFNSVRSSLPYLLLHAFQVKPFQCRIPSSWLWRWRGSCNMVQHQDFSEGSSPCA